jgi:ubiquinone/menaquinone biosynthesis C-methylase UbiE
VIEVGAGNGLNFAHYPASVTEVIAVEPEPHLRSIAEANAAQAAVPVKVVDGTAGDLPADDALFDVAVASLVLCSVPDQDQALAEIRRVLKPGGELRFFEHVQAGTPGRRRVQQALDATIWP